MGRALVDLLGGEATDKLIAECGGARIWIPVRSRPESMLTRLLGEEASERLSMVYGGDYFYVPRGNDDRLTMWRRIAELRRQGMKCADIGPLVGCSSRTVMRVLNKTDCPSLRNRRQQTKVRCSR